VHYFKDGRHDDLIGKKAAKARISLKVGISIVVFRGERRHDAITTGIKCHRSIDINF